MSETDEAIEQEPEHLVCEWCEDQDQTVKPVTVGRHDTQADLCRGCRYDLCGCHGCGRQFASDDVYTFDDYYWCNDCEENSIGTCGECDTEYYVDDGCSCSDEREDRSIDGIHNYGYKPYPFFHNVANGQIVILSSGHQGSALYVGCELETETVNGSRADTLGAFLSSEFFYLKEDCSLTNGYEVVSHPATLEAWELLRADISRRFAVAIGSGVRAWTRSSCGLHFHLSRASFTPAHTMRFHKFIMENAPDMIAFAGRESGYGSFYSDGGKASDRAKGYSQPSRGCAINYYNDNTIELRFFRPTLDAVGFFGIVQFVFAVHAYTKQLRSSDAVSGGFPFRDFVLWLEGRAEYAQALARIVSRVSVKAVL